LLLDYISTIVPAEIALKMRIPKAAAAATRELHYMLDNWTRSPLLLDSLIGATLRTLRIPSNHPKNRLTNQPAPNPKQGHTLRLN